MKIISIIQLAIIIVLLFSLNKCGNDKDELYKQKQSEYELTKDSLQSVIDSLKDNLLPVELKIDSLNNQILTQKTEIEKLKKQHESNHHHIAHLSPDSTLLLFSKNISDYGQRYDTSGHGF